MADPTCPRCGGPLRKGAMSQTYGCSHCGYLMPEEAVRYILINGMSPEERTTKMIKDVEARAQMACAALEQKVRAQATEIEKLRKMNQQIDLDAKLHRVVREKADYTQWTDDEDCLTDETRGGMRSPPKERVIF